MAAMEQSSTQTSVLSAVSTDDYAERSFIQKTANRALSLKPAVSGARDHPPQQTPTADYRAMTEPAKAPQSEYRVPGFHCLLSIPPDTPPAPQQINHGASANRPSSISPPLFYLIGCFSG
jgi:hypothetical protein